jgi:hypothetical protein
MTGEELSEQGTQGGERRGNDAKSRFDTRPRRKRDCIFVEGHSRRGERCNVAEPDYRCEASAAGC